MKVKIDGSLFGKEEANNLRINEGVLEFLWMNVVLTEEWQVQTSSLRLLQQAERKLHNSKSLHCQTQ